MPVGLKVLGVPGALEVQEDLQVQEVQVDLGVPVGLEVQEDLGVLEVLADGNHSDWYYCCMIPCSTRILV